MSSTQGRFGIKYRDDEVNHIRSIKFFMLSLEIICVFDVLSMCNI